MTEEEELEREDGCFPATCSAWVEEAHGTAFLVCDWGDGESTWFPIQSESSLAPSQWADHPADNAPAELQQRLWDLGDEAWNKWKQNDQREGLATGADLCNQK